MRQLISAVECRPHPGMVPQVPHTSGGGRLAQTDRIPTGWYSELEAARQSKDRDV